MARYHIYTDARHPNGTLAAGSLLSIFGDAAMTALITIYADETTGTALENPYTVPITGICNFWVEDVTPWVLAENDTTPKPIYVSIAGGWTGNVRDSGATGGGSTDDTAAIHALRDIVGEGGSLLFPPGTYLVTGLTASVNNQTWTLMRGAILKLAASANTSNITVTADGFTLIGGTIDGNAAGQSGTYGSGTYTGIGVYAPGGSDDITVEGVEITNCKFMGLDIRTASRVTVNRCYVHTVNRCCLHIRDVLGMVCTGNHFYNWARDYTYLAEGNHSAPAIEAYKGAGVGSRNLVISSNVFTNTDAVKFAIESSGTLGEEVVADSVISGNLFDGNGYGANGVSGHLYRCSMTGNVHVNGGGTHRSGYEIIGSDVIIASNVIREGRIAIAGATSRITINGNSVTCSAVDAKGICFGTASGPLTDVAISNNSIDVSGASGSVQGIFAGTYGEAGVVQRVAITGNTVDSFATGIRLGGATGSSDITVTGNCVYSGVTGIQIDETNYHDEVTITGNDLRGATTAITNNATGGTYRVYQNILADNEVVPDITGARASNAALADLLTSLATLGLITDSSTAS